MAFDLGTLIACIACLVAGFAVAVRSIILAPGTETWPEGPRAIRVSMFILGAVLIWTGMTFLLIPMRHHADWMLVMVLSFHAAYQVAMLVNIIRQNYPARIWRAINRIQKLASCPREMTGETFGSAWFTYSTADPPQTKA